VERSSAPSARRATTSLAPAARSRREVCPPVPQGFVNAKHIYEALLTGPQQMPVFSDHVLTPEDKADVIAT
jgi:hypothetical protein